MSWGTEGGCIGMRCRDCEPLSWSKYDCGLCLPYRATVRLCNTSNIALFPGQSPLKQGL